MADPFNDHAQEIVPGLWVGSGYACSTANRKGFRTICVLESPCALETCTHMRILQLESHMVRAINGVWHVSDVVEMPMLEKALDKIDEYLKDGPVLVHCAAGIERSPLTVAMWLTRRRGLTLPEAYGQLMGKRSMVEDRTHWLPEGWDGRKNDKNANRAI